MDNTDKSQDKAPRKETGSSGKITLGDVFRMRGKKGSEAEKALREMFQPPDSASQGQRGNG